MQHGPFGANALVRSNINYNVRKDLVFDQLESLAVEISKPRSKSFIVATWYRPPNSPFELFSDFESFVGKLDAVGKEYYLMGDLNCNMLSSSLNNVNTQALLNITDIYNLKQLINEPTRVTPVSSTLLMLFLLVTRTMYLALEYLMSESVTIV